VNFQDTLTFLKGHHEDRCTGFERTIGARLKVKWPNDLLLGRAKFAGILIEGEGGDDGVVAVGIGVNCTSHPVDADYPATDLAAAGALVSPAMLFGPLSLKMIGRLAQWNSGEGFSTVRADWMARAAGIGEEVRVALADRELSGRFEAIDQAGSLMLRLPDGHALTITAADVLMRTASAAAKIQPAG
jgi:BirA family biotin operon repressor/biotin-[acetyl-CoA-carboxylase] ligase